MRIVLLSLLITLVGWATAQTSGDLRLVRNGYTSIVYTSGRLEIYYSGRFGSTTGTIWLDNVRCRGTESRLTSCSRNTFGVHNCFHFEDVAIYCSCSSTQFRCTSDECIPTFARCGGIRTCSDGSDERNCMSCGTSAFRCSNLQCIRSSDRCDGTQDCTDGSDEIGCAQSSGDLRLVRNGVTSSSYTSGRLEVYYSGQWGTVCNDFWSSTNSRIACRQLGFAGAASPTSYRTSSVAGFGTGSGRIWLDNVRCRGTESRLTSCRRNSYGVHNCFHSEDVAIYCSTTSSNSGTSASGNTVGTAVGTSLASLVVFVIIPIIICLVIGRRAASRRRQPTVTSTTRPVSSTTTVVITKQSVQRDAYPAAGTDVKKAPPPPYEMSTYPPQGACPYPPQEAYPPPPPQNVYPQQY